MKRVFYFCMTLTLTLCIVLASCPFKASATSIALPFDVPYVFAPNSSWSTDDVVKEYGDLSEEQKRALHYIVGSNATMYGVNRGLSVEGVTDAVAWLGNLGERINTYIMSVPYQALNANSPLRRNLSNLIDYVSTSVSSTFESWYDSIVRLGHFGTVYNSDYAQGWTDLVGSSSIDSILNWQTQSLFVSSRYPISVDFSNLGSVESAALANIHRPLVFVQNLFSNEIDVFVCSADDFLFDRFIVDTSRGYQNVRLTDSSFGTVSAFSCTGLLFRYNKVSHDFYSFSSNVTMTALASSWQHWDLSLDSLPLATGSEFYLPSRELAVNIPAFDIPVYITDGTVRPQRLETTRDLGIFADTVSRTVIYNPSVPVAIDALDVEKVITGDYVADSAREYVESVALSLDDAQATTWNKEAVSVTITNPLADGSGLTISPTFFSGFTSYIDYLWSFAEPLVLYTRDLLVCLTFDGQGLSWIFFGICSLGVIGGVVYKFLQ